MTTLRASGCRQAADVPSQRKAVRRRWCRHYQHRLAQSAQPLPDQQQLLEVSESAAQFVGEQDGPSRLDQHED